MFKQFINTKIRGDNAEQQALGYLTKHGLHLIEQNYRCRQGEIDLIMLESDIVIFVEVRLRNNPNYGSGADSVTTKKQNKIITTAQHFLQKQPRMALKPCRFDVVSVNQSENHDSQYDWIKDAFQIPATAAW